MQLEIKDTKREHNEMLPWAQGIISNWNMSERSSCAIFKAESIAELRQVLALVRERRLSIIAHGAGHSYTDAALNTNEAIVDVTGMRRILSWDPERGIIDVEPGVTLRDLVGIALPDHWWPVVTPSTADATVGGCVAMNVNGKNAWKDGVFGEHVLSFTVLLASGQMLTLSPESDPELFRAFVGSAGLLGMITSVKLQLRRIPARCVDARMRPAASTDEIFKIFQDEQTADFLEAWVDGFARGRKRGRGIVTAEKYSAVEDNAHLRLGDLIPEQLKEGMARCVGTVCRPLVNDEMRIANSLAYRWCTWRGQHTVRRESLFRATYYPSVIFTGYRALLPQGTETFQAFVPSAHAQSLCDEILHRSQENDCVPLWCIVKRHRRDPFLLSYQVDGFSLEFNYRIEPLTEHRLRATLQDLMESVIAAGGRFYLAKDSLLTPELYRRSVGGAAVDTFLRLKQRYDPEMLFQSNLYRRVFSAERR